MTVMLKRLVLALLAGALVSIGVLAAPLSPPISHPQVIPPEQRTPNTAAYFNIVQSGREVERLVGVSSADGYTASLRGVTGEALDGVELRPHTRVDFSPNAQYILVEGLTLSYYEGDTLDFTLRFESGKAVRVTFDVLQIPPEGELNFTSLTGFQIRDAWVQATASADGALSVDTSAYDWQLPAGFPMPHVPSDNPMTQAKVDLGRYLFYDTQLSGNGTQSCSSCHLQALAFSDGRALPVGSTGDVHPRNAMGLTNSAYSATLTWANPGLTEFERQIVIPMFGEHPVEMGITGNEETVLERFRQDAEYQALFATAFPDQPAADRITFHNVVLGLSSFVRTLISGNSPYDLYVNGDESALSESAKRGMALFTSEKLECHHCHTGFNMSLSTRTANSTFEERPFFNTGLYNIDGTGRYPTDNTGVYSVTNQARDMGRFRPPTLRNITLTAPYMHDGSIASLEEVITFYSNGGRLITEGVNAGDGRKNPYKSGLIPGFTVTNQETADLIAFLESLTDQTFITAPRFSDPFAAKNTGG